MRTSLTYNLPVVSLHEPILITSACCDISPSSTIEDWQTEQQSLLITAAASCLKDKSTAIG